MKTGSRRIDLQNGQKASERERAKETLEKRIRRDTKSASNWVD